jgi:hypothetical protein
MSAGRPGNRRLGTASTRLRSCPHTVDVLSASGIELIRLSNSAAYWGVPWPAWCDGGVCRDEGGDFFIRSAGLLEPIAVGQLGLRLDAELSGAFVKFTGEMRRQRAGAPKRGEGWGEAGQVDGDDALVEKGVESAAAVREIAGERRQPSGGSAYRAHEFVTYQLSPRRQALGGGRDTAEWSACNRADRLATILILTNGIDGPALREP